MFGGLAFLVAGHPAVSADDPRADPFLMRGQEMAGWLHVHADDSMSEEELRRWVERGVAVAKSLPPR